YTIEAVYTDPAGNFTTSNDSTHTLTVNPIPSFIVTNTNDSGTGSLRAALASAATAGGGNITFDAGAFGSGATITLQSSLTIPDNTTITGLTSGGGASLQNLVTVDGGSSGHFSIFTVNSGTTGAAISNLVIAHGSGLVAAPNVFGGGIINSGTLTVTNSTFSANTLGAAGLGGAIYNDVTGTLTIAGSTFSGNSVGPNGIGGAILNANELTVTNSTFSANSAGATGEGGAIFNAGTMTLTSDTFSGNSVGASGFGGALFDAQVMTINNSILSQDGDECAGNGCPTSILGGNLIDPTGTQTLLAPLGNYGGPTQTMILLPGSLAICAGSASAVANAGLSTDQRGTALGLSTSNAGTYTGAGGYCSAGFLDMGAVETS
ncbi:MAG: choice-of-anchor Q domain-containing protein, partial [Pseudolabrys sp.]